MNITKEQRIKGGIYGALIGDALGCPVEFVSREELKKNPVTDMRGFGTHFQEPGTYTDDGSLTLASIDSLVNHEFNTQDMGERFLSWMETGRYSARGSVFDIGMATSSALHRIARGVPAESAGGTYLSDNGNGAIMRIIGPCIRFADRPTGELLDNVQRAGRITHGHAISHMAVSFYALMVRELLNGETARDAFSLAHDEFNEHFSDPMWDEWMPEFDKLTGLADRPESEISSGGYVLDSLFASAWCLMNTSDYRSAVTASVNLGGDCDSTGCICGALAGILYSFDSIPQDWLALLPKRSEIDVLVDKFVAVCDAQSSATPVSVPAPTTNVDAAVADDRAGGVQKVLHLGRHLTLVSEKGWEYVERSVDRGVVAVVAVTNNQIVLTEQYRTPVHKNVIDLPAGLIDEGENACEAAHRELKEETGFEAESMTVVGEVPTSPGLTSETVVVCKAGALRHVGAGGGVADERIKLHVVPIYDIATWLEVRVAEGALIDPKVYTGLMLTNWANVG